MIILGTNSIKDTSYNVANSCRFDAASSACMHKTPSGSGNRRTFTFSTWVKKCKAGGYQDLYSAYVDANNISRLLFWDGNEVVVSNKVGGSFPTFLRTNARFRDPSAWYHVCIAIDTTDSTEANRVKIYVNGTQQTSFAQDTYPSQNEDFFLNHTNEHNIGQQGDDDSALYFGGYLAETVMIDGLQLAPSSFGEFDEDSPTIWKPKDVSGLTFGTNGFYLDFEDSSNLGNDKNGGTDFTEVNLAATDQSTDTCTNNFATLNPLHKSTSNVVLSEGNLKVVLNQTTGWQHAAGTIAVKSGKWYWEAKALNVAATDKTSIGVLQFDTTDVDFIGNTNTDRSSKGLSGHGAGVGSYSYAEGEIVMCAMDIDNNKIYWGKDGTWFGTLDPAAGSGSTTQTISNANFCVPVVGGYADSSWELNFGNPQFSISSGNADANGYGNFEFAPPSGFLALCTKNLGSDGG